MDVNGREWPANKCIIEKCAVINPPEFPSMSTPTVVFFFFGTQDRLLLIQIISEAHHRIGVSHSTGATNLSISLSYSHCRLTVAIEL